MADEARFLVVAIDVGTTYSGYAMSFTDEKYAIQAIREVDGHSPIAGCPTPGKVPTALLLKPDGSFHSFGHKALHYYNIELDEEGQKQWMYFSRFKMSLHQTKHLSRSSMAIAANGKEIPLKTVFAFSLGHFKDAAIDQISSCSMYDVAPQHVKWVITVPAIWDDGAKQIMREAAYEGGLTSLFHPERLVISLEPEAAAVYCKAIHLMSSAVHETENTSVAYESGTRYLLADLGGGTVDVAVHEVQQDDLIRELHHATGGAWGGTYVDANFVDLLVRVFGQSSIDKFRREHQGDWVDLMSNKFESAKRCAERNGKLFVELPFDFYGFMISEGKSVKDSINRFNNADVKFSHGKLTINYPEVRKLFEPVFANILAHLKHLLEKISNIKFIILVGGFATCRLLQDYLKDAFEKSFGLRVIAAREPSLSVVMGSVLFGHDPLVFLSRRVKYTYGVESSRDFRRGVDPESQLTYGDDGVAKCAFTFTVFVRKNTEIEIGQEIVNTFSPLCPDSIEVKVIICTSDDVNPRYTTDEGVKKAAVMKLSMPNTAKGKNRVIKVFMQFGATEVVVRSEDMSSGNMAKRRVLLDFL